MKHTMMANIDYSLKRISKQCDFSFRKGVWIETSRSKPLSLSTPRKTQLFCQACQGSETKSKHENVDLIALTGDSANLAPWAARVGWGEAQPLSQPSQFIQPKRIAYTLDGKARVWDMMLSLPSVAIMLFHTKLKAAVLVRQFRPAVYASLLEAAKLEGDAPPPITAGFTYELCAGLVDKRGKSLEVIAAEEVREECGYHIQASELEYVSDYLSAIGISGSKQTMFHAQVDESMRVSDGGGLTIDGEAIQVLALPICDIDSFMADSSKPKSAGLMWGLLWMKMKYS